MLGQLTGGSASNLRHPATDRDMRRAELAIRSRLPEPLRDLYAVTDGYSAFYNIITPAQNLGSIRRAYRGMARHYLPGGENEEFLASDTRLTGDVIAVSGWGGRYLLYMRNGPDADSIWVFDAEGGEFIWAAPSLDAMFECWAATATTGPVVADAISETWTMLCVDFDRQPEVGPSAEAFGCAPAAIVLEI